MMMTYQGKYRIWIKIMVMAMVCLFLVNSIVFISEAHALAPSVGTRNPLTRCEYEIFSLLRSGRLIFDDEKADATELLDHNKTDVLLLAQGKILARVNLKKDPPKLFRKIIHEQIEAILQIMAREDRSKYSALMNMVLSQSRVLEKYYNLFSQDQRPSLSDELLANDILAKAFEILISKINNLIEDRKITLAESEFLKTIEPLINVNKHNYFTGVFWESSVREQKIRVAMTSGMSFVQVVSTEIIGPVSRDFEAYSVNRQRVELQTVIRQEERSFISEWESFFKTLEEAPVQSQSGKELSYQGIRHIVFFYPFQLKIGGVQTFQRNVIRTLLKSDKNLMIDLIYLNSETENSETFFKNSNRNNRLYLRGIPVVSRLHEKLGEQESVKALEDELKKIHGLEAIDLISLNSSTPHFALMKAALSFADQRGIASHYHFHGGAITEGVRYLINNAGAAVTDSAAYQRVFSDLSIVGVGTLYPVVDITSITQERSYEDHEAVKKLIAQYGLEGRKIILHPARIASRKGQEITIRAAGELLKKHPGLRSQVVFVILGPERSPANKERYRLRSLARTLGVDLILVEGQSLEKLRNWYDAAYLVLYPTLAAEPFGLVSIEAQARGVPVIVSDGGGLPETLEDGKTGFVNERGNYHDLANKIYSLVSDEKKRNVMGAAARRFVQERFALENIIQSFASSFLKTARAEKTKSRSRTPEDPNRILSNIYNEEISLKSDGQTVKASETDTINIFPPSDSIIIRTWKQTWMEKLDKSQPFWRATKELPMPSNEDDHIPIAYDPLLIPSKACGPFERRLIPPMSSLRRMYSVKRGDPLATKKKPIYIFTMHSRELFEDPFNPAFVVRAIPHPKVEYDSLIVSKNWEEQRLTPEIVEVQLDWVLEGAVTEFHHWETFVPHLHIHLYASETVPITKYSGTFNPSSEAGGVAIGKLDYPLPHIALRSGNKKAMKKAIMLFSDYLEETEQWFIQDVMLNSRNGEIITMFVLFKKESPAVSFSPVGFIKSSHAEADENLLRNLQNMFLDEESLALIRSNLWVQWVGAAEHAKTAPIENMSSERKGLISKLAVEKAFTASLRNLNAILWQEFGNRADEMMGKVSSYEQKGQSLILYADDMLENAFVIDLENTVKNILAKHNVLNGGKIIFYYRNGASAAILEKMIKHAAPNLETVKIAQSDLQINGDEEKEVDALLRVAKAKGVKELLGLIRGPTNKPEELAAFAKNANLPIVIVGSEKGVYSFAQAIAIDAKLNNGATNGWLIMLPPIRALTDDIKRQYEEYQHSLQALIAA